MTFYRFSYNCVEIYAIFNKLSTPIKNSKKIFAKILNFLQPSFQFSRESEKKKILYFTTTYRDQRFESPTLILQNNSQEVVLEDFSFLLAINTTDEPIEDLEIKILEKTEGKDEIFGFVKLNIKDIVHESSSIIHTQNRFQGYFTCINAKNSGLMRLRLGLVV